ncbi:MAG: UDP-N-acetylmuramoyl-L-alanyl-D-glutamate--2,6-diaminopimelate ligase [Verrucomicrobia bacterium]|nr:UDP-N-acetylmuramoyl-L-alanyl-D-glutamate--2,6-diaminopimelate ligase [Verrucomicrobiota bacterium]MBU4291226.1 UDP-N-acetylmuramoyl-L-alanyl-D-glutamate--2,6-diaminopimelate ligase [Verrucomicrobiota bacterium]MBU4428808.1 UDP-N-acetylmuramoyl-L-alanyl-D-glutamate--2,6-diaminopimelate ligase [Verrucomicrobiota bacterium]MCG2680953.1 UDP-N-acetylmuramoyl-L-alanyl-D-glutamate--2,6-diaminopimelate ligase [Kiritimatiellia bacterium]
MKLSMLMERIQTVSVNGSIDVDVKGITHDSRHVKAGFIFCALPGQREDGNRYVQDAIDQGAIAIVSDRATTVSRGQVVSIQVDDPRETVAAMACAYYGDPSRKLEVLGITGTNGKTTTAFMARDIFRAAGRKPGLIGTVDYEIGDRIIPADRTTPEAADLQKMLAEMVHVGCQSAAMEVSSHSLIQKRAWGIEFDVAVFTNLTHDHLDYHETLPQYFDAKMLLFQGLVRQKKRAFAVVNVDDPWGEKLVRLPELNAEVITYGLRHDAMVRAERIQLSANGSDVDVQTPWGFVTMKMNLPGRFNVYNALAAMAACGALHIKPALSAKVLSNMSSVPGRLEEIKTGQGFQVFVDYAHTEDALQNVLTTLREITFNRLIVVFGCGGNRDKKKRPLMGSVVARLADYAILTSDNPRKENPSDIIAQIRSGIQGADGYEVVEDRYEAIVRALSLADKGDVVLIAGKGHENYQEFANTIIPFDDRQIVRECLGMKK